MVVSSPTIKPSVLALALPMQAGGASELSLSAQCGGSEPQKSVDTSDSERPLWQNEEVGTTANVGSAMDVKTTDDPRSLWALIKPAGTGTNMADGAEVASGGLSSAGGAGGAPAGTGGNVRRDGIPSRTSPHGLRRLPASTTIFPGGPMRAKCSGQDDAPSVSANLWNTQASPFVQRGQKRPAAGSPC